MLYLNLQSLCLICLRSVSMVAKSVVEIKKYLHAGHPDGQAELIASQWLAFWFQSLESRTTAYELCEPENDVQAYLRQTA